MAGGAPSRRTGALPERVATPGQGADLDGACPQLSRDRPAPTDPPEAPTEGGRRLSDANGLRIVGTEDRSVVLMSRSGTYRFSSFVEPAPTIGGSVIPRS